MAIKKIVADENNTRSASQTHAIKLKVENTKYEDVAYVLFYEGEGLEKIDHRNESAPKLYIREGDKNYDIAVKENDVEEIPVSFESKKMGEFTISVSVENYPCDGIILIDNKNGNTIDILKEKYTFMATSSDMPERFTIKISHNTDDVVFIYTDNNNIIVDNMDGNAIVNVYDVRGNVLVRFNTSDSKCVINTDAMASGVYVVNVTDDKGIHTQKVVK